ncbi:VOC family protein [Rummeliibacillus pycnus]|uniref:VOC family protein n=1 Tax=Rummeliibacillus pycnus TaxID=101070 RepID=UPI000C9B6B25|nr:VOC family protein [Rummeliibacillus pycnus]
MNLSMCMISIKVTDIEKAKQFYCKKLGFQFKKAYGNQLVELNIDDLPIIIEEVSDLNRLNYSDHSQIILGLKTKNLLTEMKELKDNEIELLFEEPQKCPPGIFNVIKDPFGNFIEILEFQ